MIGAPGWAGGGSPFGSAASRCLGIGVLRAREEFGDRALLDDLARGHHADALGDLPHDAEVVGDEQHRHAQAPLQLFEKLEDLRLHGDVERGGRLVGDEQVGLVGERHGDHHPLALAAGKLVRIGGETRRRIGDADFVEQLDHALACGHFEQPAMHREHLADLPLDRVQRIERGHRLLEDHRDLVAAHGANVVLGEREKIAALEQDLAGGMRSGGIGQQLQDRQRGHRLARAGFADQRHGLALVDVEGDAVGHERVAAVLTEGDREVLDLEQRIGHGAHAKVLRGSKASRTASPTKISSDSMIAMVKKPVSPSHGA